MPLISVILVRLSFLYLFMGASIGSLLLAAKGLYFWPWIWSLRPLHIEFLLFGWMVQLAFGVAAWILPRTQERTNSSPLVLTTVLLNAGIWMAGTSPINVPGLTLVGRLLEIGGIVTFAWYIWPRVRSFRG